jgi:hypothetical protein
MMAQDRGQDRGRIWRCIRYGAAPGLVITLTLLLLTTGCSLPRRYYPVKTESIRDLPVLDRHVKRIGVCRFNDRTSANQAALVARYETALREAVGRNCGKIELVNGRDAAAPDFLKGSPSTEDGRDDNYTLTQTARGVGFQVVVKGELLSLRHRVDRSGWSRFRKSHHFLDLRLQTAAIDTVTAAKIAQHSKMISLPIDAETGAAIDAGKPFDAPKLVEQVNAAGIDLALKLCAAIRAHPWLTVVRATRGTGMILAAQPAAGLEAGDRLAVFDGSRTIAGDGGERFVLAGFRQGTLIIKSVSKGEVSGYGEDGAVFPVGSILVPVRF